MATKPSSAPGALVKRSDISGFYKKSPDERWQTIREFGELEPAEVDTIRNTGALRFEQVDRMIENVVGTMPLPLGVAVNFRINGKDYLVPMAIEEPSVVAAASNAARIAREHGGFTASSSGPIMFGQIQLVGIPDPNGARITILSHRDEILSIANEKDPMLVKVGGGARDIEVRVLESSRGPMVITHLIVDCRDAMGANAVNTMAEAVAPHLEKWTGGRVYLRIISNLAVRRLARSRAIFAKETLKTDTLAGEEVVEGILEAYAFAEADPFRCATHNKGVMNGIDAVVVATGNDWRAIEAGAHSYAAWKSNGYRSLTTWEKDAAGNLVGTIELPMAVGLVGGATAVHPTAKANVKLLGVKSAQELGEVIASVGLAQNFAALRALATEGIQRGHMSLHARNIAATVGAVGDEVDRVVEVLVKERKVRMDRAKEVLTDLRAKKRRK
jgi:hydroxymethylglutaryl-CoA reductase